MLPLKPACLLAAGEVAQECRTATVNAPPMIIMSDPCFAAVPAQDAQSNPITPCTSFTYYVGTTTIGDCSKYGMMVDNSQCWIMIKYTPPGSTTAIKGWIHMADTFTGPPAAGSVCGPALVDSGGHEKVYVGMCGNAECGQGKLTLGGVSATKGQPCVLHTLLLGLTSPACGTSGAPATNRLPPLHAANFTEYICCIICRYYKNQSQPYCIAFRMGQHEMMLSQLQLTLCCAGCRPALQGPPRVVLLCH